MEDRFSFLLGKISDLVHLLVVFISLEVNIATLLT